MHELYVYNSLIKSKELFIPENVDRITWYQCGPTVYSDSHIGHARTYISLDIIHRIMRNYLNYNLIVCQNITDIDDKIIIKSNDENIDFKELSSKYEKDFFSDMKNLGVIYPDILTRVSEYVNEIINYIEDLYKKGFAYEINGSIYFDILNYQKNGFTYGKLVPEQIGNTELLQEGEGKLSSQDNKKSESDFVLWKKTKDENKEPYWDSPWGKGRPGWHIECSVMSYYAFKNISGGYLDVHAGGVDLKFPHHENEEAQSSAYLCCKKWTKYWLHTGHLNIKGLKMSKSLKNFITIKEALSKYTARQIRFCFLIHKYNNTMDYSEETMNNAINIEKTFSEFFHNTKAILRKYPNASGNQYLKEKDNNMIEYLEETKIKIHRCILDDFDTPKCINHLMELMKKINKYIDVDEFPTLILFNCSKYITYILRIFGLMFDDIQIGFNDNLESINNEEFINPFIDSIVKFRDNIRNICKEGNIDLILEETDKLRDKIMPELGIRIEDKNEGSIWKKDDPEIIKSEIIHKQNLEREKNVKKEELLRKKQQKFEEQEKLKKILPENFFRRFADQYSRFDKNNIPTHDIEGKEISKNLYKKLKKQMEAHIRFIENKI
jgi:cysteinyl-tRNA synthetase